MNLIYFMLAEFIYIFVYLRHSPRQTIITQNYSDFENSAAAKKYRYIYVEEGNIYAK